MVVVVVLSSPSSPCRMGEHKYQPSHESFGQHSGKSQDLRLPSGESPPAPYHTPQDAQTCRYCSQGGTRSSSHRHRRAGAVCLKDSSCLCNLLDLLLHTPHCCGMGRSTSLCLRRQRGQLSNRTCTSSRWLQLDGPDCTHLNQCKFISTYRVDKLSLLVASYPPSPSPARSLSARQSTAYRTSST